MAEFSHIDAEGRPRMVDVSGKSRERRTAVATGRIALAPETVNRIAEKDMAKGDVLTVAELAGVQAAKQTAALIPLCHSLPLAHVEVRAQLQDAGVAVTATATAVGQTGVEMEALTAVSAALLTVYDMCKAVDTGMEIGAIRLVEKRKDAL